MAKRRGENLARTEGGSVYNKLQRPNNWPAEPPRKLGVDDEQEEEESSEPDEGPESTDEDGSSKIHITPHQRVNFKRTGMANGCLSLENEDSSGVSFAALEYLKNVRQEAEDIPIFSTAYNGTDRLEEDYQGYYEDGAYVVAPEHGPILPTDYQSEHFGSVNITPCEAYTASLLGRFYHMRTSIRALASRSLTGDVAARPKPLHVPVFEAGTPGDQTRQWVTQQVQSTPPTARLAVSRRDHLLRLLYITKLDCLQRGKNLSSTLGQWIFATLAVLDETTLDSDDISILRDLAKKAFWLRIDYESQFAETSYALGRENGYINEDSEDEQTARLVQSGKVASTHTTDTERIEDRNVGALQSSHELTSADEDILSDLLLEEYIPNDVTKATLDMIITIVGEAFGQRDLLESRTFIEWANTEIAASDDGSVPMELE